MEGQRLRQSQPAVRSELQPSPGFAAELKPVSGMLSQERLFQSLKASEAFVGQAIL